MEILPVMSVAFFIKWTVGTFIVGAIFGFLGALIFAGR